MVLPSIIHCVFRKIVLIGMGSKCNSLFISKHGPAIDYSAIQCVKFHYLTVTHQRLISESNLKPRNPISCLQVQNHNRILVQNENITFYLTLLFSLCFQFLFLML